MHHASNKTASTKDAIYSTLSFFESSAASSSDLTCVVTGSIKQAQTIAAISMIPKYGVSLISRII